MEQPKDPRNIRNGRRIPTLNYCDQPYVVKTDDGAWLCTVTTGLGREGNVGQHVVTMRSTDKGQTWSEPVPLEPADRRENSYAVLLKAPTGRIFCFYNHNTDDVREIPADEPPFAGGICRRVDSLGYYVFKVSDDGGRTWTRGRCVVPIREMAIDRENATGGRLRFGWNVGRPFIHEGAAYISFHKVGGFGHGFFTRSEGVLVRSADLLTVADPAKVTWKTLPDGDHGLRTPAGGGTIAEEQSYCVLSDGSFFAVYRTRDGHPVCASSRDGGHTWSDPAYMRYADGRLIKHPRAANFAWRCANGKYLYWFHNHGGRFIREAEDRGSFGVPYEDRNPVWLCGGVEADAPEGKIILWSQPEIVLYDDDPYIRMSYPDLIEDDGGYFLTETQKQTARVHQIDPVLLEGLWGQFEPPRVATEGLLLHLASADTVPARTPMPVLPAFIERGGQLPYGTRDREAGFALDIWFRVDSLVAGQTVLDARTESGRGLALIHTAEGTLEIVLNDGRTENRWTSDRGMLEPGRPHHAAVVVDGGPKIITFIVDGRLCDGGAERQFGWGRFSPNLRHANGSSVLRIAPEVSTLRLYGRALRTSEAVGNYRSGA